MRLLKSSTAYTEKIKVGGYTPGPIGRFFCKSPIEAAVFSGRTRYSNPVVDFDISPVLLGFTKKDVLFGDIIYYGLSPCVHIEDDCYECTVDYIKQIEIGKV